jgi:hypothetical protein
MLNPIMREEAEQYGFEVVLSLLSSSPIEAAKERRMNLMTFAIRYENEPLFRYLVEKNDPLHQKKPTLSTNYLHWAAIYGTPFMVETLLAVNAKNRDTAALLLAHKCDASAKIECIDPNISTAFQLISSYKFRKMRTETPVISMTGG